MTLPRIARWGLRLATWSLSIALALALGFTLYAVTALLPLEPWHTQQLKEEFDAQRHAGLDFEGYLRLEARLFDELRAKAEDWARDGLDPGCTPAPACNQAARRARVASE